MTLPPTAYQKLEAVFARRTALMGALGILHWDSRTMMPAAAAPARAEQVAALELVLHEQLSDPRVADWLAEAEAMAAELGDWQRANLREMRRVRDLAAALPAELVEAQARAHSRAEAAWRTAKPAADFAALRPFLEEVLSLKRQEAAVKAGILGCGLYDALHDGYEPGNRVADFAPVFDAYADWLPGFLDRVEARQAAEPAPLPMDGHFPIAAQRELAIGLAARIGYAGRVDETMHAFCGGATGDVRITSRFDESNWFKSLKSSMHETGHALYEQGRPQAWMQQPVGFARGLAVHESQSLTFDMQVGRHPRFLDWLLPQMKAAFGVDGPGWTVENMRHRFRQVQRTLIRVDADEVTYPAHVILRWRLEQAMLEGRLEIADLPGAWNEGLRGLLGITPPDDGVGCMQDLHWPMGLWGYFPTYTLGAMMAAQLFQGALADIPGLEDQLGRGEFAELVGWLRDKVHRWGRFLTTRELLIQATGKPLDASVFQRHLERRYLP